MINKEEYTMDTIEAAQYLNRMPSTLVWWRAMNKGPRYLKIGRDVRYSRKDLDEFLRKIMELKGGKDEDL